MVVWWAVWATLNVSCYVSLPRFSHEHYNSVLGSLNQQISFDSRNESGNIEIRCSTITADCRRRLSPQVIAHAANCRRRLSPQIVADAADRRRHRRLSPLIVAADRRCRLSPTPHADAASRRQCRHRTPHTAG